MPVHSQADWQSGVMMYMQGDQQTSIGTHQQGEDKFTSPHLISCICQGCSRKSCDSANPWIFLWIPGYPGTSASLMCYTQGTQQIPGSVQKGENWQHQLVTTILYNGRDVRSVFSGRLSKPGRCLILFLQDLSSTAARRAAASDTARTPDTAKALKSWDRAATRTVSWKLYSNLTYSLLNSRQIEAKKTCIYHTYFLTSTSLCVSSLAGVSADSLSLTRRTKPDTKWTQRLTFLLQHYTVAWTHLQPKKSKATISTYSRLSQVTGLYIIIWTSRPGPVLTTLERLLHCACIWVNIGLGVLVYIVNLLISAHIQLVHIWILYVCFLSLCSHRPIDIFLIWKINCGWIFCFFFSFWKNFQYKWKRL